MESVPLEAWSWPEPEATQFNFELHYEALSALHTKLYSVPPSVIYSERDNLASSGTLNSSSTLSSESAVTTRNGNGATSRQPIYRRDFYEDLDSDLTQLYWLPGKNAPDGSPSKILVAFVTGRLRPIGCSSANDGYISSIGVNVNFQGRGYGRMILEWMLNKFAEHEIYDILLHVRDDNQLAIELYERSGFKFVKKIPKYYRGNELDGGCDGRLMVRKHNPNRFWVNLKGCTSIRGTESDYSY